MPAPTSPPAPPPIPIEQLLGKRCTEEELQAFPFDVYRFIIQSLRTRDLQQGNELLRRYLVGVQEVWCVVNDRIQKLRTLFDPNLIEERFLDFARHLVGFTADLDFVVRGLSTEELRRLYAFAHALWKNKAADLSIPNAVRTVTGFPFRIRDYFDLRMLVDETSITEELQDFDPNVLTVQTQQTFRSGIDGIAGAAGFLNLWSSTSVRLTSDDIGAFIVVTDATSTNRGFYEVVALGPFGLVFILGSFPGTIPEPDLEFFIAFLNDEFITELRVVDPDPAGTFPPGQSPVNRQFLRDLLDLVRPSSERIDIVYIVFLDEFAIDDNLDQWLALVGTHTVSQSLMTQAVSSRIRTDFVSDTLWDQAVIKVKATFRSTSGSFLIRFASGTGDVANNYFVTVDVALREITLSKAVAGVPTVLDGPVSIPFLKTGVFDTYTIELHDEVLPAKKIRVKVDGALELEAIDSAHDAGRVILETDASAVVDYDLVEVLKLPATIERVGPNP